MNRGRIFGETYMIDGRKPSQGKVNAIQEMPPPQSKKQVQSFIGMVNYFSKFSTCLSELTELICELAKERVPFNWGPEHDEAYNLIKKETNGVADRCKLQRARSMSPTK